MKIRIIIYLVFFFFLTSLVYPSIIMSQGSVLEYCRNLDSAARCRETQCRPYANCDTGGEGVDTGGGNVVPTEAVREETLDQTEDMEGRIGNPALPGIQNLTGTSFLQKILRTGIVMVLITGSIVFFFILTSGGIKWLSSSGDKTKLESAQKQISAGLVGLAILLSSFAIIKLIEVLFGIDLLNFTLPTL